MGEAIDPSATALSIAAQRGEIAEKASRRKGEQAGAAAMTSGKCDAALLYMGS